jgi:hypothetical protein
MGSEVKVVRRGALAHDLPSSARNGQGGPDDLLLQIVFRDHRGELRALLIAEPRAGADRRCVAFGGRVTHELIRAGSYVHCLVSRACDVIEDFTFFIELDRLRTTIGSETSFRSVLNLILQKAIQLFGADRGAIGYYDWKKGTFLVISFEGKESSVQQRKAMGGGPGYQHHSIRFIFTPVGSAGMAGRCFVRSA